MLGQLGLAGTSILEPGLFGTQDCNPAWACTLSSSPLPKPADGICDLQSLAGKAFCL